MKPLAIVLAALVPLATAWSAGGEPVSAGALQQRLERLEAAYARESKELAAAGEAWERERAALRERRAEQAARVLDLQLEREQLRASAGEREARVKQVEKRAADEAAQAEEAWSRAVAVAEQLDLYLAEVPGSAAAAANLDGMLAGLRGRKAQAAQDFAQLLGDVHAAAGSVTVRERSLRTASGESERVQLLSIGHMGFAYQVVAHPERIGVALESPAEAAGFRWTEALDSRQQEAVTAALRAARAGASHMALPMDVSGRLRAESALERRNLGTWVEAGGPVMIPLCIVALLALGLIVERVWFLLRQGRGSGGLMTRVVAAARAQRYEDAERDCERAGGVVARTLGACLRRRSRGAAAMEDSIQEQLLHELPRMQKRLGGIATLAAIAPLLGLLGTVTGIIQTFGVLKVYSNANPGLMAGGISEALVTTASGLVIAIPILLMHSLLSGRIDGLIADAERNAATLYNVLGEQA